MAETVRLIDPRKIVKNDENPRLIFREDELIALEESIQERGILVPLTLFDDGRRFVILDGERRWRCALKLGLSQIPAIVQPKPDLLTNIMMMFAIHKARSDWDPLPTALKLQQLEKVLTQQQRKPPTEEALAAAASLTRGEVRRYRRILEIPEQFKKELMGELEKPRDEQVLTVDHVLEAARGAEALRKREVIDERQERALTNAILAKFRAKIEKSTVAPRLLPKIARAVEREEVSPAKAREAIMRLIKEKEFTVDRAFKLTAAKVDFEHSVEQLVDRLSIQLEEHSQKRYSPSEELRTALRELQEIISKFLHR